MKNKLIDLNNHLFAQMERLGEEGIDPDKLRDEIARSGAMSNIASRIIDNGRLALDAAKFLDGETDLPQMLGMHKPALPSLKDDASIEDEMAGDA